MTIEFVNVDWLFTGDARRQRWLNQTFASFSPPLENEPSVYDLQSSGGASPVGGFIYRGCQSRRLYGSYVFGDKNG